MNWNEIYKNQRDDLYLKLVNSPPDEWETLLVKCITSVCPKNAKTLEAGSGYGRTSYLIGNGYNRTLIDLEEKPLSIARKLFRYYNQEANIFAGDLFDLPFSDNHFCVTFNAGVLEHFTFEQRVYAIKEMVRVTKMNGFIIIAVPNHYSWPYRFAYWYQNLKHTWRYPQEDKIYDLRSELMLLNNVEMLKRETCSIRDAYYFLSDAHKMIFKLLGKFVNYEGYLSVFTLQKR